MEQATPLSETEFDELDNFLMSNATGEDAMDLSMLDGFLTALAIGPHTVPADEWLPMVWGRPVRWPGTAVAERMTGLVLRHANHLSDHLRHEPDLFVRTDASRTRGRRRSGSHHRRMVHRLHEGHRA